MQPQLGSTTSQHEGLQRLNKPRIRDPMAGRQQGSQQAGSQPQAGSTLQPQLGSTLQPQLGSTTSQQEGLQQRLNKPRIRDPMAGRPQGSQQAGSQPQA
ncbi:MAG: hypothetical protein KDA83_12730, partial [Planctomycetales bacterium]|nr:hypothetical protein [Planctomycetales bacterium]